MCKRSGGGATVELIINIFTNYVGVDKWEAYN